MAGALPRCRVRLLLAVIVVAAALAIDIDPTRHSVSMTTAAAQTYDDRFPFLDPNYRGRRQPQRAPRVWGPQGIFPGFGRPAEPVPPTSPVQSAPQQADFSRAPAPRKAESDAATRLLVIGDAFADWLAYGLEQALEEQPDIAILRRHRTTSSLIRSDQHNWAASMAELARTERPTAIIVMIGVNERQAARETVQAPARPLPLVSPRDGTPVPSPSAKSSTLTHEFRSDRWVELYADRIDRLAAALKALDVPVIWLGLPAIRGQRSTSDMVYLNDLLGRQVEKAGITFIPVWEAFVDDEGDFTTHGPDFEGQVRRLRSGDGVYFTRVGARTLAHFAERALERLGIGANATPVALPAPGAPSGPPPPTGRAIVSEPEKPAPPRPLAGAIIPLSVQNGPGSGLMGAPGAVPEALTADGSSPMRRVLLTGQTPPPVPGRADDHAWPEARPSVPAAPAAQQAATGSNPVR